MLMSPPSSYATYHAIIPSLTKYKPTSLFHQKHSREKQREHRAETMRKEKSMDEPKVLLEELKGSEWPRRRRKKGSAAVKLEGYVDDGQSPAAGEDGSLSVGRTKSLTDEDLEELKGCLDLGFGFSYEEIPELCGTLPALELCYSMSQRFLDEQQQQQQQRSAAGCNADGGVSPVRVANWKISNPGDHPDEVKARLKYWAQAVACTVKLCS